MTLLVDCACCGLPGRWDPATGTVAHAFAQPCVLPPRAGATSRPLPGPQGPSQPQQQAPTARRAAA